MAITMGGGGGGATGLLEFVNEAANTFNTLLFTAVGVYFAHTVARTLGVDLFGLTGIPSITDRIKRLIYRRGSDDGSNDDNPTPRPDKGKGWSIVPSWVKATISFLVFALFFAVIGRFLNLVSLYFTLFFPGLANFLRGRSPLLEELLHDPDLDGVKAKAIEAEADTLAQVDREHEQRENEARLQEVEGRVRQNQQEVVDLQDQNAQLGQALEAARNAAGSFDQQLGAARALVVHLEQQLQAEQLNPNERQRAEAQLARMNQQVQALAGQLQAAREDVGQLGRERAQKDEQLADTSRVLQEQQRQLEVERAKGARIQAELAAIRGRLDEAELGREAAQQSVLYLLHEGRELELAMNDIVKARKEEKEALQSEVQRLQGMVERGVADAADRLNHVRGELKVAQSKAEEGARRREQILRRLPVVLDSYRDIKADIEKATREMRRFNEKRNRGEGNSEDDHFATWLGGRKAIARWEEKGRKAEGELRKMEEEGLYDFGDEGISYARAVAELRESLKRKAALSDLNPRRSKRRSLARQELEDSGGAQEQAGRE